GRTDDDARAAGGPSARGELDPRRLCRHRRARVRCGCARARHRNAAAAASAPGARMTERSEVVVGVIARERRRVVTDLVALTKPRVVLMVLVTTLIGYYVA